MKKALGRGLGALIPESREGSSEREGILEINIDKIIPNKDQPRKNFNDQALRELSYSIKEKGIIQPIIVIREEEGTFRIIAGERRWRAAKLAGFKMIPVIIKDLAREEIFETALIENIQREDLNPLETAEAFQKLINDFNLTHDELSQKVGKERVTISNYIRILRLPEKVRGWIADGFLTTGHAKAILQAKSEKEQINIAEKVIQKSLSVRETEKLSTETEKPEKKAKITDPNIVSLENKLTSHLGTKVKIHHKDKKGGKIEIHYYSLEELDRLLEVLL